MINEYAKLLKNSLKPGRAMDYLRHITQYHRVQCSPMIQEAQKYCVNVLKEKGIKCELKKYDSHFGIRYFNDEMFPEWECSGARLSVSYPETKQLCDYDDDNMCLFIRSYTRDFEKKGLELVHLKKGSTEKSCKNIDLKGKVLLLDEYYGPYLDWALKKKGAIGIISDYIPLDDGIRTKYNMAECRTYKAFASKNLVTNKAFGFSVSINEADYLRDLCEKAQIAHKEDSSKSKYPILNGYVHTDFHDGKICDVLAEIPGKTDDVVLIVAHICHPKPCANDNASGSAGAMELMVALNELINKGLLEKPKMTIKMLLVPEMSGTNAYLASLKEKELNKIKAGVVLDMIGAKQGENAGPINIFKTPDAICSFVNDLAELAWDEVKKDAKVTFLDNEFLSLYNFEVQRFCFGSDHQILNDPQINIPSVCFTQWPDKYYHTNYDTVERIDPQLLVRSAAIGGCVAYTLANLKKEDLSILLLKMLEAYNRDLSKICTKWVNSEENIDMLTRKLDYRERNAIRAIDDFNRFIKFDSDIKEIIKAEKKNYSMLNKQLYNNFSSILSERIKKDSKDDKLSKNAKSKKASATYNVVYRRLFKGNINGRDYTDELNKDKNKKFKELSGKFGRANLYITYWIDGKRTVNEIFENVYMETGMCTLEYVNSYLLLLQEMKLVERV